MPLVDDLKVAAAGHEYHAQAGLAHAVHRVERDAQLRLLYRLNVYRGKDAVNIIV